MRQAGRVLPSYLKLREQHSFHELMRTPELAAQVTLLPVHELGVDAAILFSDILVVPEALGMHLDYTNHGPVFSKPLGANPANFDSLRADTSKLQHVYKAIEVIRKEKPANIPLIGFCGAPFTTFCYMVQGNSTSHSFPDAIQLIYRDKRKAYQLLEIITELSIEYAVTQVKHGIDVFQLFETHAGLLPYELYLELVLPFVNRITQAVRAAGCPTIFFPKDLGAGLKHVNHNTADYLSVGWQDSLTEVRRVIDPRVGLQGNFDPRIFSVARGEVLVQELDKYRQFGKDNYNWIFNAGHGLSPNSSHESVREAVEWIKTVDWYR